MAHNGICSGNEIGQCYNTGVLGQEDLVRSVGGWGSWREMTRARSRSDSRLRLVDTRRTGVGMESVEVRQRANEVVMFMMET